MSSRLFRISSGFLLVLCFPLFLLGQSRMEVEVQALLETVEQLTFANKNDTALLLLEPFLRSAEQNNALDPSFRLKIKFLQAKALRQDNQDATAVRLLKTLQEQAKQLGNREVFVKTSLELAQLYEKIYRANEAKAQLRKAREVIDRHQLDGLRTEWMIRAAFWHHNFGYPDSTAYYAKVALKRLEPTSNLQTEVNTYTLLGLAALQDDFLTAIDFFKQAIQVAKTLNDYTTLSKLYYEITFANVYNVRWEEGQKYVDSTIMACYQAIAAGHDNIRTLGDAYNRKALLFEAKGQFDSAYYYLEKGAAQNIRFLEQQQLEKLAEVDAQYEDQQKSLRLIQQEQTIRQGLQIRYLLIGIIISILALVVIVVRNYYQQKQVNETITEQALQLQKLDEKKSRFFANVSHELRTPLTLIKGPVQHLQQQNTSPAVRQKLLHQISRSSQQLETLVNEILDLEKLSAGELKLNLSATNAYSFFNSLLIQFESLANYQGIQYSYEVNLSAKSTTLLDRKKYRQIIYNLLSNAFKYTSRGGYIEVHLNSQATQLQLLVKDTGSGISPRDLPHVFDRYYQSNQPEAPIIGGTGIGLAICKEYTELMGGSIRVESQKGIGTRFHLQLPLLTVETESDASQEMTFQNIASIPLASSSMNLESKISMPRLLLVEDNLELLAYLQTTLNADYAITTAQNGAQALDIIAQHPTFDLILTDLMMPVMDGQQLLKNLKTQDQTRHIPTIMLTARADMGVKLSALRMGIDDYILKPFHEQELKTRIKHLIKNQANRTDALKVTSEPLETTPPSPSEIELKWLIELENTVRQNLDNDLLSVPFLAAQLVMSKSSLLRQLKQLTGLTPNQYIQEARLQKARQLLETRSLHSISEVARAVGYPNPGSFSRAFKNRFGKAPSEL